MGADVNLRSGSRHSSCLLAVVTALVLACASCERKPLGDQTRAPASSSSAAQLAPAPPIEMFSWWARIGEADALGAMMRVHNARYPGDVIINASAELSGLARSTLRSRMLRNEPPDTFQANVGSDLMQWVLVNGLDARESKLTPLDDVIPADVAEWRRVMPAMLLDHLSYDGKIYAAPSNVHRLNTVFYNKRIFAEHGLAEPKSLAELKILVQKLEGTGVSPIALGSREPWTLALFVFECLLVSREGATFYDDYFRGNLRADDPKLLAGLREALSMFRWLNPDHPKLSWLQALDLVVRGRAAMTVMGDWARVSFNAHGLKIDQDYGEFPFPGSEATFVYTSDSFSLPLQAKNKPGAKRLLTTIGSRDGQRAMNLAKGSLSARSDVPPPDDPKLAEKHRLLLRGPLVLALSGLVPPRFADDVAAALAESAQTEDIEPIVQTLRSRYILLK